MRFVAASAPVQCFAKIGETLLISSSMLYISRFKLRKRGWKEFFDGDSHPGCGRPRRSSGGREDDFGDALRLGSVRRGHQRKDRGGNGARAEPGSDRDGYYHAGDEWAGSVARDCQAHPEEQGAGALDA